MYQNPAMRANKTSTHINITDFIYLLSFRLLAVSVSGVRRLPIELHYTHLTQRHQLITYRIERYYTLLSLGMSGKTHKCCLSLLSIHLCDPSCMIQLSNPLSRLSLHLNQGTLRSALRL